MLIGEFASVHRLKRGSPEFSFAPSDEDVDTVTGPRIKLFGLLNSMGETTETVSFGVR
jgi:hypothetical protein